MPNRPGGGPPPAGPVAATWNPPSPAASGAPEASPWNRRTARESRSLGEVSGGLPQRGAACEERLCVRSRLHLSLRRRVPDIKEPKSFGRAPRAPSGLFSAGSPSESRERSRAPCRRRGNLRGRAFGHASGASVFAVAVLEKSCQLQELQRRLADPVDRVVEPRIGLVRLVDGDLALPDPSHEPRRDQPHHPVDLRKQFDQLLFFLALHHKGPDLRPIPLGMRAHELPDRQRKFLDDRRFGSFFRGRAFGFFRFHERLLHDSRSFHLSRESRRGGLTENRPGGSRNPFSGPESARYRPEASDGDPFPRGPRGPKSLTD